MQIQAFLAATNPEQDLTKHVSVDIPQQETQLQSDKKKISVTFLNFTILYVRNKTLWDTQLKENNRWQDVGCSEATSNHSNFPTITIFMYYRTTHRHFLFVRSYI